MYRRSLGLFTRGALATLLVLSILVNPFDAEVGASTFATGAVISPQSPSVGAETRIIVTVTKAGASINNAIVDLEVYNAADQKVFQHIFERQRLSGGVTRQYAISFTPTNPEQYTVKLGIFSPDWSQNYLWENSVTTFTSVASLVTPEAAPIIPPSTPPVVSAPSAPSEPTVSTVSVWWPTDQARVSGEQPFKAVVDGRSLSSYTLFWQVDGGQLNELRDTETEGPHKEAVVNLSGWNWKGEGPYVLTFVAKDTAGISLGQKSVQIYVGQTGSVTSPTPTAPVPTTPTNPVVAPVLTPSTQVHMTINADTITHTISPFIYGTNVQSDPTSWDGATRNLTLARFGGNRLTTYNWENNASNAGIDWQHQSDGYLGGGDTPGKAVADRIQTAHTANAAALVTVPIQGYVAKDKQGDGDVVKTPNYLDTRFARTVARKPSGLQMMPDTTDNMVYQDEFVNVMESLFPEAKTDGMKKIFYSLDNEPDLWSETHPRIQLTPVTYAGLLSRSVQFASAIKSVAPHALVFGTANYGYNGFESLQNATDANGRNFIEYYLDEMKKGSDREGKRLLDVLDVHWYPEAQGGGRRIIADDADESIAEARMQAPRSLWDPTYIENSWITEGYLHGQPITLLPSLKQKIATHYPGTKLAVTEYYYGGGAHISGAIAEADVLGIFGREDVFAANLWHLGGTDHRFIYGGFAMYRNFDGQGSTFGSKNLAAMTDNVAATSIYASRDEKNPNRITLVVINKKSESVPVQLSVKSSTSLRQAEVYQLTAGSPAPQKGPTLPVSNNEIVHTLPPHSISTIVVTQ